MKIVPYKYTILVRLRKLPVEEYEIAMKWLPNQCGVTNQTFRNWIYLKNDQSNEIPGTALLKLATFFECAADELLFDQIQKKEFRLKWTDYKNQYLEQCSERYKQASLF